MKKNDYLVQIRNVSGLSENLLFVSGYNELMKLCKEINNSKYENIVRVLRYKEVKVNRKLKTNWFIDDEDKTMLIKEIVELMLKSAELQLINKINLKKIHDNLKTLK